MTRWRFDIVVVSYKRARSFTENAWKLGKLSSNDRISFVSACPSVEEEAVIRDWANSVGVSYRYVGRQNRGLAELARIEYFLGECGGPDNLNSSFVFTMQDHYLDVTSPWSKWDGRFDNTIKGDVVPDDMTFDLDFIQSRMLSEGCIAAFADRHGGAWIQVNGTPHISPSGGNFIIRTDQLSRSDIVRAMRRIQSVCDNTYWWALYAEFMWGTLFFNEGIPVLDLQRNKIIREYPRDEFYVAPDDFAALHRKYSETLEGLVLRSYSRVRRVVGRFARKVFGKLGIKI